MEEKWGERMEKLEKSVNGIKTDTAVLKVQLKDHCDTQKDDIQDIKSGIGRIEKKMGNRAIMVDSVLNKKADKSEVNSLNNRFWGLLLAVLGMIAGVIIYIIERVIEGHLKF